MTEWNPRFVAYAAAHDLAPEDMLAADSERWHGGIMCGFILWISERWQAWDKMHGHGRDHFRSPDEHAYFDAWIASPNR